jgi:hypothetical protein
MKQPRLVFSPSQHRKRCHEGRQDTAERPQRITYNTRHFSGNYLLVIAVLALYAMYVKLTLFLACKRGP